ncbi:MAG: DUF2634 domain-containing protein [Lachnospiraceae bacterium]|jgi:hypothetical protein|nr:DUF2634 domain-containing protein [Lachnospiraceae bacterium]
MLLDNPIPFETIGEEDTETSRTYLVDWGRGRIGGFIDGEGAVRQFIKKALMTPRFKCLIYDSQYGSEIQDRLMDPGASMEYIEAEVAFLVEDALIHDGRILGVGDVEVIFGAGYPVHDSAYIRAEVDTIFGVIHVEEAV